MENTTLAVIAIAAALAVLGVVAVTLVTITIQQQQAYAAAAQTFTTVLEFPVEETFVPCAAGGEGEEVQLTGTAHSVFHVTLDGAGGLHVKGQVNLQGVTGTGLTTGDKYQATDAVNLEFNSKVGREDTSGVTANFIGQGNAPNFQFHALLHFTVNADGTVTAFFTNERVECK